MNETTEKINIIEKPLLDFKAEPIIENTLQIKEMQLRDINKKFNAL
jgi:hypothetical protein